jgi:hypothetical protein
MVAYVGSDRITSERMEKGLRTNMDVGECHHPSDQPRLGAGSENDCPQLSRGGEGDWSSEY